MPIAVQPTSSAFLQTSSTTTGAAASSDVDANSAAPTFTDTLFEASKAAPEKAVASTVSAPPRQPTGSLSTFQSAPRLKASTESEKTPQMAGDIVPAVSRPVATVKTSQSSIDVAGVPDALETEGSPETGQLQAAQLLAAGGTATQVQAKTPPIPAGVQESSEPRIVATGGVSGKAHTKATNTTAVMPEAVRQAAPSTLVAQAAPELAGLPVATAVETTSRPILPSALSTTQGPSSTLGKAAATGTADETQARASQGSTTSASLAGMPATSAIASRFGATADNSSSTASVITKPGTAALSTTIAAPADPTTGVAGTSAFAISTPVAGARVAAESVPLPGASAASVSSGVAASRVAAQQEKPTIEKPQAAPDSTASLSSGTAEPTSIPAQQSVSGAQTTQNHSQAASIAPQPVLTAMLAAVSLPVLPEGGISAAAAKAAAASAGGIKEAQGSNKAVGASRTYSGSQAAGLQSSAASSARSVGRLPASAVLPSLPAQAIKIPAVKGSSGVAKATDRDASAVHEAHVPEKDSSAADTSVSVAAAPGSSVSVQPGAGTTAVGAEAANVGSMAASVVPPQTLQTAAPTADQPAADGKRDGLGTLPETGAAAAATQDAQALAPINTARVIQSMQGSEMRVGMHSAEFGNVSVSALLNRQSIAAQISFEHMDLGKALTAHLPSMEARLSSDYGMHAKVEVRDQSLATASEGGRGESRRDDAPKGAGTNSSIPASTYVDSVRAQDSTLARSSIDGARLDVQA